MANIQITNFVLPGIPPPAPPINFLNEGNIQNLITHIDTLAINTQQKIEKLLDCLSQTMGLTGIYQGKCASELTNRILQYTVTNIQEAESAIAQPSIKFNPGLQSVISKMKTLIPIYRIGVSLQQMRMDNFFPISPPLPGVLPMIPDPINVFETGDMQQILNHIETHVHQAVDRLPVYLGCLAQSMSARGPHRGTCESQLKQRIYALTKENPMQALRLIEDTAFKENSKLKPVLAKMKYLTANWPQREWHHLKEAVVNNRRYGVNYLTVGFTLLLVGGLQVALGTPFDTDENRKKKIAAWITAGVGISMIILPLFESIVLSKKDEP